VSRQVQRGEGGTVEIRLPKYGSERVVPIPDELLTVLSAHIELGHRGDWLFAGPLDHPPHQNTVGYWWRKTLGGAGLSGIRLHDLRHFYASGLIAASCDVVTVQRALGHAKATTTLETYSHLWPSAEDKTRKAAGALAWEVLGAGVGNMRAEGGG
jgi:integrase